MALAVMKCQQDENHEDEDVTMVKDHTAVIVKLFYSGSLTVSRHFRKS